MSESRLILVKHSQVRVIEGVPSREWLLSPEGERRARELGRRLAAYRAEHVLSSVEKKAAATAQLAAREMGCAAEVVSGLHENDRTGLPVLPLPEFRQRMRQYFAHPNKLVMGNETADQAHQRFASAVRSVIEPRAGTIVVVSHGAVITLFVSRCAGLEPFALWEQLDLPSYVVMSRPELDVVEIVPSVTEESGTARVLELEK